MKVNLEHSCPKPFDHFDTPIKGSSIAEGFYMFHFPLLDESYEQEFTHKSVLFCNLEALPALLSEQKVCKVAALDLALLAQKQDEHVPQQFIALSVRHSPMPTFRDFALAKLDNVVLVGLLGLERAREGRELVVLAGVGQEG